MEFIKLEEKAQLLFGRRKFIDIDELHENVESEDYEQMIDTSIIKVNHELDMIELIKY